MPDRNSINKEIKTDGITNQIPEDLLKVLQDLLKYEPKILRSFKNDPTMAKRFLTEPATVLSELEIPVDNRLRERLKISSSSLNFLKLQPFCLPNGKEVTPKINISIKEHLKENKV